MLDFNEVGSGEKSAIFALAKCNTDKDRLKQLNETQQRGKKRGATGVKEM